MSTRKSIAYRMTRTVVLLTLILGLLIGSVQVVWDYHQRLENLSMRVVEVVNSIEKAATKAVYTFDNDLAAEVAAGLFEFQPIISVDIKDENHNSMTTLLRYPSELPYNEFTKYFFKKKYYFKRPLRFQGNPQELIGTLSVEVSPYNTVLAFLKQSLTILGAALLQSFVISILLLFVFYKTVTRPLHFLAHDFKRIDPTRPEDTSLRLEPNLARTEFEEVTTAGNNLLKIVGSHLRSKDIAEANLKKQKEETERFLHIAEAIILKLDNTGKIVMVNQRGLDVLGYDANDIIGRDWFDLAIPPEERHALRQVFIDLFRTNTTPEGVNKSSYYENEIITKTGERRLIFWHNALELNRYNQPNGVLSSGQDITARKKAEEALLATEGSLRAIIEATSEGFVIADLDRREIIDINSAFHKMLGYNRDEMFNRIITEFIHHDDISIWEAHLNQAKEIPHQSYELRFLKKNGDTLPVEINASVLPGAPQENMRSVAFITDISARKEQEESQKALEKQLRQAQKMETIGTLAGGIAHDFNNILTPILGYSSLLSSRISDDDPNHARIQQIAKSANRAANMVKQILTFSRRAEGELVSTHIPPVLNEAMQLVKSTTPANIDIHQHIPTKCEPVVADSTQIQQLILNLCTNANHAMGQEGGVLDVRLEEVTISKNFAERSAALTPGPYLKLTVTDSGHGMNEETITRIFDPFYSTKKSGEGTGLGLAMVHGIVQNHNGDIQVESEPGKGTTFTVYLPITNLPVAQENNNLPLTGGNDERALIIDDEVLNTQFLEELLEETGYQFESYTDSIEALDAFVTDPDRYQIILTDQTMPKMSGDQMVKAIREIKADIPIIMMSGYDKKVTEENAMEFGVDIYIQKPVSIDALTQAMNELLKDEGREDKTPI
ncbi:PAS domain S-box protein [Terasakiella sp. A23]|uniref:PAS domain-containing hybrid sensor histidine kinase/response regulator n=1 Tax=Terasakiella sp. FCG-A23 TaxID=3080561 RepID=UPI002954D023|nr:PAS domain S-box protein [Terasakiella sp. A23]MDV7340917.1 PAS domain S-box protein [Terasakiella sp. A23]